MRSKSTLVEKVPSRKKREGMEGLIKPVLERKKDIVTRRLREKYLNPPGERAEGGGLN